MTTPHYPDDRDGGATQEMPVVAGGVRRPARSTGTGWPEANPPEPESAPARTGAAPTGATAAAAAAPAPADVRSRRARLVLTRVDPWSVMKLGFLLSIALGIVLVVAVAVLWSVLDGMGVFDSVNHLVNQVITTDSSGGSFKLQQYAGTPRAVAVATILALVNVVLMTALTTLGAFLYNIAASLVGGLHVTLSEDV